MRKISLVGILLLCVSGILSPAQGDLKIRFYDQTCPKAEEIILDYVKKHVPNAPTLAASFLRMHFHDCFVRGCDASVLINSTSSNSAEKDAIPNQTLRNFDFIDRVKSLVESECPGVVSCADVLALVARDAVVATGGPSWQVPTGRRDGTISNSTEASNDIPAPSFNFSALQTSFASKGLDVKDLVLLSANREVQINCSLGTSNTSSFGSFICTTPCSVSVTFCILGAHTIGIAHCPAFSNRLFNFTGVGDEDPSLDSEYAANLKKNKCKTQTDNTTILEMDPGSFRTFDLSYYSLLLKRRGLFESDAALVTNSTSRTYVTELVEGPLAKFFEEFATSMEKMGRIEVKTGSTGEIRKNCAVVNG